MKAAILGAILVSLLITTTLAAETTAPAANAINSLGIDLLRQTGKADANALLSPYSIETALVMTYAGADGVTREEMAKVLHLTNDEVAVHGSFGLLQRQIAGLMQRSAQTAAKLTHEGLSTDPITLNVANRLFGQQGFEIHDGFLKRLKLTYDAQLEFKDFIHDPSGAANSINDWVDGQTRHRIRNAIPKHGLNSDVRLVLVNAIYLKAPWEDEFWKDGTEPQPFHVAGGARTNVSTMSIQKKLSYAKFNGFTAVTIPYKGNELQFLILLPDATNGLAELEGKVAHLAKCANLPEHEVLLYLPKFKLTPPAISLADALKTLGMTNAFSPLANFDRITEEKPFFIFNVFHKAFLSLDEKGTEAAAATEVIMGQGIPEPPPKPIEVRVDHPFLFAIQHRASGACLFLGHVTDPR